MNEIKLALLCCAERDLVCHGFVLYFQATSAERNTMEATTKVATYRVGNFMLDSVTEESVAGYAAGERWNGWACPYFDKTGVNNLIAQTRMSGIRGGQRPSS